MPVPEPRRVIGVCINKYLFTMNVPGLSITTWSERQLFNFAWIAAELSPPLGERVAQMVVRLGIPPLDIIPGFQVKFLSDGIIDPDWGALQDAFAPPFDPLQAQVHGPVPLTVVAVPAVQRFPVGAVETATPFAEPQTPSTGEALCSGALHEEFDPPLLPLHAQAQGPAPVTVVAVPVVQRPIVGVVVTATPFAEPQAPLTSVPGTPITPSPVKSC